MIIGGHITCENFEDTIDVARRMDAAGFERLWAVDSQMLWEDAYVYATRILQVTDRIVFGTAVSNPLTRHYTVSASAMATLDRLHPGRAILGLGRGDSAVRTLGYRPVPTKQIEDILVKARDVLSGSVVDEDGSDIYLRWADKGRKIPLMYGATGPANLRIGGRVADIVMLQVGTHPAAVEWAISHVHAGAREAGRDPKDVQIALLCGMWVSEDRKESRNACRWAASCATNHLEEVQRAGNHTQLPDALASMLKKHRDQYDYYAGHLDSKADHSEYLSDEMIDDFSINGPAEECLRRIAELKALGVNEISSAYYNGHGDQVDRVGREIIPHLKH